MSDLLQAPVYLALALLVVVGWQCARMMQQRNYIVLLLWPVLIYLIGPAFTLLLVDHPVLSRYIEESRITPQTLLIAWYFLLLVCAGNAANLSASLKLALGGSALQRLSSSPLFPVIYVSAALLATALQIDILATFGTIFTGAYVLDNVAEGLIPYWGFLAGLYEIIFLCFILALIGKRPSRRIWLVYIALYCLTTSLRVMGGTRLILIKELAFMVILFSLRGSIKPRQLLLVGIGVVAAGSAVGFLRSEGSDETTGFLGPLYGLVMESALNALTLGIADQVNMSGAVARDGNTFVSIGYLLLSVIPSFLRFGVSEADMLTLSPYSLALSSGFDTAAPVGGMSGFATVNYLSSYPFLAIFAMVTTFVVWFKVLRNRAFKQIVALVIAVNAIHFWRDPADIAFKLLVQGMVICTLLLLVPPRKRLRGAYRVAVPEPRPAMQAEASR